jgi:phosphatidylglycerophosphate synthase
MAIDPYIRKYIFEPIASKLDFVDPNVITIISTLFLIPIFMNMKNYGPVGIFIFLIFIINMLDFLDGSIARAHNKTSKCGAILDLTSDALIVLIMGLLFIYMLYLKKDKYIYNKYIILIFGISLLIYLFIYILELHKKITGNILIQTVSWMYTNSFIINIFIFSAMKLLIMHQK